jgi:hypothetical protein
MSINLNESDLRQLINLVINEEIKDGSFNALLKKVQTIANGMNVGGNKAVVTVEYGEEYNDRYIMVHYTSPFWKNYYHTTTPDDEIYEMLRKYSYGFRQEFMRLQDFFQNGFQGFKDTFSKGLKTVDVSIGCYIRKINAEKDPTGWSRDPKFYVYSYSMDKTKDNLGEEKDYKNNDLNIFNAYIYIHPRNIK